MTTPKDIYFAPLQGFTDAAYRKAHHAVCGGVEAYYAPFLRLEHGELRRRDVRDVSPPMQGETEGVLLIPQVIAADVEEFRVLTKVLMDKDYRQIDINMGCPFPMQTRLGRGAGMLQHPETVTAIMKEVAEQKEVAFSIKMRLGLESANEWQEILPILNAAPLCHITVHPRIGKQQYKGEMDMSAFASLYAASKHPVIYNGDLTTVADIEAVATQFPNLAGIMIGRGLLARPTLAEEYQTGKTYSDDEVRERILAIHREVLSHYEQTLEGGDAQVLQKILPFWEYAGAAFDHRLIKHLKKSHNLQEYKSLIDTK